MARALWIVIAASAFGCWTLTSTVPDVTGGTPDGGDASIDVALGDAAPEAEIDAGPIVASGTSCLAIKEAKPASPDGAYRIDPDGDGPVAAFDAYCDMTTDGGGWMLVTSALGIDATSVETTIERSSDARGGLVVKVYANNPGCLDTVQHSRHLLVLAKDVAWSRVRARQTFKGAADCWTIFSGVDPYYPLPHNLLAFDKAFDVTRDSVLMGGGTTNEFAGATRRCDNDPDNFWAHANGTGTRATTVLLRRAAAGTPAGLATVASCLDTDAGTSSPTWWEYRDIYVR